jgi:ribosomal protein S18 acetylase RimI-like enzyme
MRRWGHVGVRLRDLLAARRVGAAHGSPWRPSSGAVVDGRTPLVTQKPGLTGREAAFQFRRYEPGDHDRVVELHRLGLRQTGTDLGPGPWDDDLRSPQSIRATYIDEAGDFLVCVLDDAIVATGALRPHPSGRVEIKRMRVDPEHQRQGLGQAMLDRLEARASELGYTGVYLDTTTLQEPAIALFERSGYREVKRDKRGSFDLVIFEKDLDS